MYRQIAAIAALLLTVTGGCGQSGPKAAPEDQRVTQIVKQSGGDWNRVSPSDREYLAQTLGHGNIQSAALALQARAARGGRKGPPMVGPPR